MNDSDTELLLAEAVRAAETHGWVRQFLLKNREDNAVRVIGSEMYGTDGGAVGCDEVASCCTVGFLVFAALCLAPAAAADVSAWETVAPAAKAVEALLWERPEVRAAAEQWWADYQDEEELHLDYESLDDYVSAVGTAEIGGEGLIPFWNDRVAGSKEDVVALLQEAAAGLTPA